MKRFAWLLALLAAMAVAAGTARAAGGLQYEVKADGTAVVTGYDGLAAEVEIPWSLGGRMVTEIGESAFAGQQGIRSVRLPIGVRVIRRSAFEGCLYLSEVLLPDYLETIENYAFKGCMALRSLTIPEGMTPEGLQGSECFEASITLTGNLAVWNRWKEMQGIRVTSSPAPTATPAPRLDYQYELRDGGVVITSYLGTEAVVRVPAEIGGFPVRTIGVNAFSSREAEKVILPEGLISLDKNAFRGCWYLTEAVLPHSLRTIGETAFFRCERLTEITIPEGVTEIGREAFRHCLRLRKVTLPSTVRSFPRSAFGDCDSRLVLYAPRGSEVARFAQNAGFRVETYP